MPTINKKVCPTCGQSVNLREIGLYTGMVKALVRVWYWCMEHKVHEFTRRDIKHLFKGVDNEIARWGDWVLFGGLVYKPEGKGTWGINIERCTDFIKGKTTIPTRIYKDPLTKEITRDDFRHIYEVRNLGSFLTDSKEFISKYVDAPLPMTVAIKKKLPTKAYKVRPEYIFDPVTETYRLQ